MGESGIGEGETTHPGTAGQRAVEWSVAEAAGFEISSRHIRSPFHILEMKLNVMKDIDSQRGLISHSEYEFEGAKQLGKVVPSLRICTACPRIRYSELCHTPNVYRRKDSLGRVEYPDESENSVTRKHSSSRNSLLTPDFQEPAPARLSMNTHGGCASPIQSCTASQNAERLPASARGGNPKHEYWRRVNWSVVTHGNVPHQKLDPHPREGK